MKRYIIVLACDLSSSTGEGYLAHSILDLLQEKFLIKIYSDPMISFLRKHRFIRDRLLPVYIFLICILNRIFRKKVILLNYVPIWNFLNGLLTLFGVLLGPITGSALILPAKPNFKDHMLRFYIQRIFIYFNCLILSKKNMLWCSTPSVYETLHHAGFIRIFLGFPFLKKIDILPPQTVKFDVFIYSGQHRLKNHFALLNWLSLPEVSRLNICYVGPKLHIHLSNVVSYNNLPEHLFNSKLSQSASYLSFSYENAGITGFKAFAYGVPVLCPVISGLAYALDYREENCFGDPYDAPNIYHKLIQLLINNKTSNTDTNLYHIIFNKHKMHSNEAINAWLDSL